MSKNRLLIEFADVTADNNPELLIEFWRIPEKGLPEQAKKIVHAVTVSSSKKDGRYDTVDVKTDADGDGDFDGDDEKLLLSFADTAIRLLKQ